MPQRAPHGSWRSPITSDLVVGGTVRLGSIVMDDGIVHLSESRPTESGRNAIVRVTENDAAEVLAIPWDARSRAHEYGGGAFTVRHGVVFFVNYRDQRLYRIGPNREPRPITPDCSVRYAAPQVDEPRDRIIAVSEEHHREREPDNRLVSIDAQGSGETLVLAEGRDFYASPRLSPDGKRLAWLEWSHPDMPWDATDLMVADLDAQGRVHGARRIAGGPRESNFQPEWGPDGTLHFVSDRSGFWNLHRWKDGEAEVSFRLDAEFGLPQWNFEMSTYAVLEDGRIACTFCREGRWHLAHLDPTSGRLTEIETPYTEFSSLRSHGNVAYFGASSPTLDQRLVAFDMDGRRSTELRRFSTITVDPRYISVPRAVEYTTSGGGRAHAFYYPPQNADYVGQEGERPPLLVKSHGGPTAAASTTVNLRTQFWTSRGIGVLDVDYRGSTGYGRAYREALNGQWGIADVDDCIGGAQHLVDIGEVDPSRLMITGGSAGGYTTLAALTFRDVFHAGASHYGISDLEALVRDTHKFESRYLDRLVGPYPAARDVYVARSPIHHAGTLARPVVFFQGLDDRVVPPNQAEVMVEALRQKGIAVAYVPFEGEAHGFRRAENIRRAIEAELFFYSRVLGFPIADRVEPLRIENLAG